MFYVHSTICKFISFGKGGVLKVLVTHGNIEDNFPSVTQQTNLSVESKSFVQYFIPSIFLSFLFSYFRYFRYFTPFCHSFRSQEFLFIRSFVRSFVRSFFLLFVHLFFYSLFFLYFRTVSLLVQPIRHESAICISRKFGITQNSSSFRNSSSISRTNRYLDLKREKRHAIRIQN